MNRKIITALMGTAFLAGCSDSETVILEEQSEGAFSSLSVDASASTAYVDLVNGQVLSLTEAEAETSTEWHIAFNRYNVYLNGGTSGSGNVGGALGVSQDDFYDSGSPVENVFLNATADLEEEHLLEYIDVTDPILAFTSDSNSAAIEGSGEYDFMTGNVDGGWYFYNTTSHTLSTNDANYWLLRSAEGNSYAKFNVSNITHTLGVNLAVTIEFDVQIAGTGVFGSTATFNADVPSSGGEDCFDFDTNAEVNCTDASWDIKLKIDGRDTNLWVNGGVSGEGNAAVVGRFSNTEADAITDGSSYSPFAFSTDESSGIFSDNSWYAYGVAGGHELWPNFRTYVIDTDTTDDSAPRYRLQVTGYYNEAAASGHPTIRFVLNEEAE